MSYENLRLLRNILLRCFVVGFVIALVIGLAAMEWWGVGMTMADRLFHVNEAVLGPMVMQFFITIRFFLLFVLLTPAIALHWTLRKEMSGN